MKRVLVLTTVDQTGRVVLPPWLSEIGRADLFVIQSLSERSPAPQSDLCLPDGWAFGAADGLGIREVFVYSGPTGLKAEGGLKLFIRAYNEGLRRRFRDLLHWGRWDALIVDGVRSVLPLIGDRGIEIPRELSWIVYRQHPQESDAFENLARPASVFQLSRWRLRRWHNALLQKSAEVVVDECPKLLHRQLG